MLEAIWDFPRTVAAWIVFHLASWLDMRVIPNDDGEEVFDYLFKEIEEVEKDD